GLIEAATNLLSKPIYLQTADGLETIAAERTPLPYNTVLKARTTDASGEIRAPFLEENNPLGEVVMGNVPRDLAVGSAVEVTVTIHPNYSLSASTMVPALNNRRQEIQIQLPDRKVMTADELERRHADLSRRATDALGSAGRGAVFSDPRKVNRIRQ